MDNSLISKLSGRYHQALAGLLDGFILRSHDRIVSRQQNTIPPHLPDLASFDHQPIEQLFPAPPVPLDGIRGAAWEQRGKIWRRDFVFPSSVFTEHEHNRRVIAQTYANDRALHFPAVIVLHGWMTPALIAYRPFCRAIVEAGASAYLLELPYHLRRTPPGFVSGELFFTADFEKSWTTMQQAVADTRQLIHYLREAGAPVIGVLGFSLGAWISAIVASCEPELDFALLAMLPACINDLVWQTRLGEPWRRQFEAAGLNAAATAPLYQFIDPANLKPLLPPERRELFAAAFDHFMPARHTQMLRDAWQQPNLHVYSSGHIGLLWSRKFLRDIRQSLARQLALGKRQKTSVTVVTDETLHNLPKFAAPVPPVAREPQFAVKK
ncbi:hypothetical protein L0337_09310 [candidate division KSB1 bacterium]|nr:hypothetical protein [candidate division KSB1 bacterium]